MMKISTFLTIISILGSGSIEQCDVNCENYVMLNNTLLDLQLKTLVYDASINTYPREITIFLLKRDLYKHITDVDYSTAGTINEYDGPYLPEIDEASDWVLRGQCKIGSVCAPNGDCYGGGLSHCEGLGLNPKWVDKADFRFKGAITLNGGIFTRRICVQDWSCSIEKHNSIVYLDNHGRPFIKPGNHHIYLNGTRYNKESGWVIWIDENINPINKSTKANCIQLRDDKFCTISDKKGLDIWLKHNNSCVSTQNHRVCLGENTNVAFENLDPSVLVTIDDVDAMKNEISVLFKIQSLNNMLLQGEIMRLKNVINKLILAVSRYNPFAIKDILGMNVYSRKHGEYLKICPCKPMGKECDVERIYQGDNSCGRIGNYTSIDIMRLDQLLDLIPLDIDIRGRETTIYESELEKSLSETIKFDDMDHHDSGGGWYSNMPGFGMFNGFSTVLTYANSFAIIILLLRR